MAELLQVFNMEVDSQLAYGNNRWLQILVGYIKSCEFLSDGEVGLGFKVYKWYFILIY